MTFQWLHQLPTDSGCWEVHMITSPRFRVCRMVCPECIDTIMDQDLQLCYSRRIPKPYRQLVARITNIKKIRNSIDCRTVALQISITWCRLQVQHKLVVVLLHNVEEEQVLNLSLPWNPNPKPPPSNILLLEEQYVSMLYRLCVLVFHRNFSERKKRKLSRLPHQSWNTTKPCFLSSLRRNLPPWLLFHRDFPKEGNASFSRLPQRSRNITKACFLHCERISCKLQHSL